MDGKYFVVTNNFIISNIKTGSKYFKVNLGVSITLDDSKSEHRLDNDKDRFAFAYRKYKGTMCLSVGEIGNIHFYVDHSINTNNLIVYKNFEEFNIPFDSTYAKEKGIDSWLGRMMMEVDEKLKEMNVVTNEESTDIPNPVKNKGDGSKVFTNPGQVRYEDLKEYLATKRQKI
jgi:hypothetical protein